MLRAKTMDYGNIDVGCSVMAVGSLGLVVAFDGM